MAYIHFIQSLFLKLLFLFFQLFERTPVERLGYKKGTNPNIREHAFFEKINWVKLEARQIEPTFKPSVVSMGI